MNPSTADRPEQTVTEGGVETPAGARPLLDAPQNAAAGVAMWIFVVGPLLCLVVAVPLLWGRGLSALDVGMAVVAYLVSGFGLTVGYHRLFTHRSFKAKRGLRIALAVAGSLGVEGSPVQWVANHRRHHAFADREGDPHSPWRFGTDTRALLKGLLHAHVGWMLKRELSNRARFAPDIAADRDLRIVGRLFGPLTAVSLLAPALVGGLVTGTWTGALTGFFWAGVMRMALLHHVTWSVNSVCHVAGRRPFASRDKATNFWPLALLSFGESWHNSHHADPTGARHGVLPGQIDPSARLIRIFEQLGWAHDVRWPSADRLGARLLPEPAAAQQESAA
ncbi:MULTISPECIES: acyl-CoA desaturase [unclassified Streptomyces]|uniref:acyl-CoA desaturase n=1 Tax=unclassified Streptomyces TaxID=2593676 RepID=UPI0037FD7B10